MKIKESGLKHLQGIEAYQIYWEQFYKWQPRLSSIKANDLNQELIIDEAGKLLAYRYYQPEDMRWMVDGDWNG